jgi:hypothetical protein
MESSIATNSQAVISENLLKNINPISVESDVPDNFTQLNTEDAVKLQPNYLQAKIESLKADNHRKTLQNRTLTICNESLEMEKKWRGIFSWLFLISVPIYLISSGGRPISTLATD